MARTTAGQLPVAGSTTVDDALDALALFARDDARSGRFEPITDAARALLDGDEGVRARRVIDGIGSWVDARPGGQLSTIAISGTDGTERALQGLIMLQLQDAVASSPWASIANFMDGPLAAQLRSTEHAYLREPDGLLMSMQGAHDLRDLMRGSYESILPRLRALDDAAGHQAHAWDNGIALLEDPTGQLARERRWDQLYQLLHELEHASSQTTSESITALRTLEEGTAELHARWPGAVEELAAHLGLAHEVSRPASFVPGYGGLLRDVDDYVYAYDGWHSGMRGYLELAGIDPTDPAQLGASRELLRGVDLLEIPDRLARRILESRGVRDEAIIEVFADAIRRNEPQIGSQVLAQVSVT